MDCLFAGEAAGGSAAAGGHWQLIMVVAGIALLAAYGRWRRSRVSPAATLPELRKMDEHPDFYRTQADKAIVDLLETSRELNAQVDVKIRMLNSLLKQGEELAGRLERLLAVGRDGGSRAEEEAGTAGGGAGDDSRFLSGRLGLTELQERILRLYYEGRTLSEIARMTALSTTEVSVTLDNLQEASEGVHAG